MVGHGNPAHIDELLETGVLSSLTTALAATGGVLCCIPLACLARVHLWRREPLNFYNSMIIVLFVLDFLDAFCMVWGRSLFHYPRLCELQGAGILFFESAIMVWNVGIALMAYSCIALRAELSKLQQMVAPAFIGTLCFAVLNTGLWRGLGGVKFGPAELWCWIPPTYPTARFLTTYAFAAFSMVLICAIVGRLYYTLRHLGRTHRLQAKSRIRVCDQLLLFVAMYFMTWFWPIVNRTVQTARGGKAVPALLVLHVLSKPSMALWDTIAFGYMKWMCSAVRGQRQGLQRTIRDVDSVGSMTTLTLPTLTVGPSIGDADESLASSTTEDKDSLSIFASTYCCHRSSAAELDLAENLPLWVPRGYDVYVIAVQELRGLRAFRALLLQHLGGSEAYVLYGGDLGTSLTGVTDALTLLVRKDVVDEGQFEVLSHQGATRGTDQAGDRVLLPGKLVDRTGAVTLPIRLYGTTIAIVAAHVPEHCDAQHQLQHDYRIVESKHVALKELLKDHGGGEGFDIHLRYQYTLLIGSLGYRLKTPGGDAAEVIDEIAKAAEDSLHVVHGHGATQSRNDRRRLWTWLDRCESGRGQSCQEMPKEPWRDLMRRDELKAAQAVHRMLYGFVEGEIGFPPTYPRRAVDLVDFTDREEVALGYGVASPSGRVDGEAPAGQRRQVKEGNRWWGYDQPSKSAPLPSRPRRAAAVASEERGEEQAPAMPSYPDRILLHRLAEDVGLEGERAARAELIIEDYAGCPLLLGSPHQPVSALLRLSRDPVTDSSTRTGGRREDPAPPEHNLEVVLEGDEAISDMEDGFLADEDDQSEAFASSEASLTLFNWLPRYLPDMQPQLPLHSSPSLEPAPSRLWLTPPFSFEVKLHNLTVYFAGSTDPLPRRQQAARAVHQQQQGAAASAAPVAATPPHLRPAEPRVQSPEQPPRPPCHCYETELAMGLTSKRWTPGLDEAFEHFASGPLGPPSSTCIANASAAAAACKCPPSALAPRCRGGQQARSPPTQPQQQRRSRSQPTPTVVVSGTEGPIARVMALFPLPSENRLELRAGGLPALPGWISSPTSSPSSSPTAAALSAGGLLPGLTSKPWSAACHEGLSLSSLVVPVAGPDEALPPARLHAVIRLVDESGRDLGQGVVPVNTHMRGTRLVSGPLTVQTTYCGHFICEVELVKVKTLRNPPARSAAHE